MIIPRDHKLSLTAGQGSTRLKFITAGHDDDGYRVRFGYSVKRNAAGYFVAFRERWRSASGRGRKLIDPLGARQRRDDAVELARGNADKFKTDRIKGSQKR